jgi:hypothetical protein
MVAAVWGAGVQAGLYVSLGDVLVAGFDGSFSPAAGGADAGGPLTVPAECAGTYVCITALTDDAPVPRPAAAVGGYAVPPAGLSAGAGTALNGGSVRGLAPLPAFLAGAS